MKRIILILVIVSCLAPGAAFAQENQTTSTPTPTATPTSTPAGSSSTGVHPVFGDPDVSVVDYWYDSDRSRFFIVFRAERPQSVTITTPANEDGRGSIYTRVLHDGRTRVSVQTSARKVSITTEDSREAGYFTQLDAGGGALVGGPYDGADVRDAGIGGAFGAILAFLYEAVKVKSQAGQQGERVA